MSYANSHSVEGTLAATSATIDFPWPVREVQVTNDSPTGQLQYKLNASETYRTLRPLETSTISNVRVKELFINSADTVEYRIWGLG